MTIVSLDAGLPAPGESTYNLQSRRGSTPKRKSRYSKKQSSASGGITNVREEDPTASNSSGSDEDNGDELILEEVIMDCDFNKHNHNNNNRTIDSCLAPPPGMAINLYEMNEHDQLPNLEDYKTQVGSRGSFSIDSFKTNRKRRYILMATVVLLATVITILAIVFPNKNSNDKEVDASANVNNDNVSSSNNVPKVDPTIQDTSTTIETTTTSGNLKDDMEQQRYQAAIQIISNKGWSDLNDLKDVSTPQGKAVKWVSRYDEMNVAIDETNTQFIQRYVLAVLYAATGGRETWDNQYDFKSGDLHECDWGYDNADAAEAKGEVGVLCDDETNNNIERLYLANNDMSGSLPSELRLLTSLKEINFYNNDLTGTIPSQYSELTNLEALVLHQNQIKEDNFPTWIVQLTNLQILNLGDNDISGVIPTNINQLSNLKVFNCDSCKLNGELLPLINMNHLEKILLGDNDFTGQLTDHAFESWINLIELDLGDNSLSGLLPTKLLFHDKLQVLDIHNNLFDGEIFRDSEAAFDSINPNLRMLALHGNFLEGRIDERWFYKLTKLDHLDISDNMLTGNIPTEIGTMTNLRYLFLGLNEFNAGPIPTEIGLLTNLIDVSFQSTSRNGYIPYQLGELNQLILLDLMDNELSGIIPSAIGELVNARFLLLGKNKLNGSIPDTIATIQNLDMLVVSQNGDLYGGHDKICDAQLNNLRLFQSNCSILSIPCRCCCCYDQNPACGQDSFWSGVDPNPEYHYARQFYNFYETDVVRPVEDGPTINTDTEQYKETLFENAPNDNNLAQTWQEYYEDITSGDSSDNNDGDNEYYELDDNDTNTTAANSTDPTHPIVATPNFTGGIDVDGEDVGNTNSTSDDDELGDIYEDDDKAYAEDEHSANYDEDWTGNNSTDGDAVMEVGDTDNDDEYNDDDNLNDDDYNDDNNLTDDDEYNDDDALNDTDTSTDDHDRPYADSQYNNNGNT